VKKVSLFIAHTFNNKFKKNRLLKVNRTESENLSCLLAWELVELDLVKIGSK
jgi:hypothetical protein